jgi:hypothetical protein
MAFCFQKNFFNPTLPVDEAQFYALVRATQWNENIDKYRETGDQRLKRGLPAFIFQATFDETESKKCRSGCWRKQAATRLTGLVVMDVDHVEDPRAVYDSWHGLHGFNELKTRILLVYITPSGKGLKIVFKADAAKGNLIDNQHAMAKLLGVEVDESCKDASRLSFICKESDILYIDKELFTYENKEFAEKYNAMYRDGRTQPTVHRADAVAVGGSDTADGAGDAAEVPDYHGVKLTAIIDKLLGGVVPGQGDRHDKMRDLAHQLRYVCDNSPKKVLAALKTQPWVNDLIAEGDPVETTVEGACKLKYGRKKPEELVSALEELGAQASPPESGGARGGLNEGMSGASSDHPQTPPNLGGELITWGEEIEKLFGVYPCLKEICEGLHREAYPAAMFTGSAFMGTLLTRTWYYFYHRPEEERRLNYCIYIIGDPASGKSFATRLYKLLLAPIIAADKVGNDAINRYKKELKERGTSSKEQKKEALKQPDVIIRIHGARTANGVFIEDMCKAIDVIGNKEMHLHMLTFDSELDSSTAASKGGQWIDKSTMELKAFHNEEDNQQYRNVDSVTGPFNVYWNYVYTGTPLSLHRKVTERNFGSGLSTRLAVIPLPPSDFKMMALMQPRATYQEDETLRTWAYRLDGVSGELPVWPLVETCWEWTRDHMAIAEINQDKSDELLLKRVAYYGISISVPFILMRHWDEWEKTKTFTIDEQDLALCELVLNIQYRCQHHWFGEYARKYFDDMQADPTINRNRKTKTKLSYQMLPAFFTLDDIVEKFGCERSNAKMIASRLKKDGFIEAEGKGHYRKLNEFI